MRRVMILAATILAAASMFTPANATTTPGRCAINVGSCTSGGRCTVNYGSCRNFGSCTVNYGTCDGGSCLITIGSCTAGETDLVAL